MSWLQRLFGALFGAKKSAEPDAIALEEDAQDYGDEMADRNIAWAQKPGNEGRPLTERPGYVEEENCRLALNERARLARESERAKRRAAQTAYKAEMAALRGEK